VKRGRIKRIIQRGSAETVNLLVSMKTLIGLKMRGRKFQECSANEKGSMKRGEEDEEKNKYIFDDATCFDYGDSGNGGKRAALCES